MVAPATQSAALPKVLGNRVPGSAVADNTRHLPPEQRDAIAWLHNLYWTEGLSYRDLAGRIGYNSSVITGLFRGDYRGSIAEVATAIDKLRAQLEAKAAAKAGFKMPFIQCRLSREIAEYCEMARAYSGIVQLFGESQIGKSEAFKHIERSDKEGKTLRLEVLPGAREAEFIALLCHRLDMGSKQRSTELKLRLARKLRECEDLLLILDEGARVGNKREYGGGNFRIIELVRWLHDQSERGVVFCGTNTTRDDLRDAEHAKYLNQWNRRSIATRQLPDLPYAEDLAAFAAHYGLPRATGEARIAEKRILVHHGLGVWLKHLAMAKVRADNEGKTMTWDHVTRVVSFLEGISDTNRKHLNSEKEGAL